MTQNIQARDHLPAFRAALLPLKDGELNMAGFARHRSSQSVYTKALYV